MVMVRVMVMVSQRGRSLEAVETGRDRGRAVVVGEPGGDEKPHER